MTYCAKPCRFAEILVGWCIEYRTWGEIIAASGATAVILVPTLSLVDQHRQKLQEQLPTIRVGVLSGEEKAPEHRGVTIITYDTLVNLYRSGKVPDSLRFVTFVFADEGHESMTELRQTAIKEAFDPAVVRIAFTATPDYDQQRALARFYPVLISEISLAEAYRLKLLAPFRVWAQVVDVDASTVELIKGDFDPIQMARLMSQAVVFETCRRIRWEKEDNSKKACLICCATQQQAYDLRAYLISKRPEDAPRPEVILSDTAPDVRRRILRDFESGKIDTIINVGVLLRGWDSKRCKLLIDLFLSVSLVRSKQKYFRPLTADGSAEAAIWLVVPQHLPKDPILPSVVFGTSIQQTWLGDPPQTRKLLRSDSPTPNPAIKRRKTPFGEVDAHSTTVLSGVRLPTLNPLSLREIRLVLESQLKMDRRLPTHSDIRKVAFDHPLFGGWGSSLLKYCGIYSSVAYTAWIQRLYPEQGGTDLLGLSYTDEIDEFCALDAERIISAMHAGSGAESAWRAVFGPDDDEGYPDPETALLEKEEWELVVLHLSQLNEADQGILRRFHLDADAPETLSSLAAELGVSRHTAGKRLSKAEYALRQRLKHLWDQTASVVEPWSPPLKVKTPRSPEPFEFVSSVRNREWAAMFYNAFVRAQKAQYNANRNDILRKYPGKEKPVEWDLYHLPWHASVTHGHYAGNHFKEWMIRRLLEDYEKPECTTEASTEASPP